MKKSMTEQEKEEYIKYLESKVDQLSLLEHNCLSNENSDLSTLLKAQEEFLVQKYSEKDFLLSENKRLNDEIGRLTRTVLWDQDYINYLLNSFWWKASLPLRILSRKMKKQKTTFSFDENDVTNSNLQVSVSVIIFTYNAGKEFELQLRNLKEQRLLSKLNILIIDRGSTDNTITIAKKYGANIIEVKNNNLTNDELYTKCLPKITGEYIVMMEQNKVVNSEKWIYHALVPIVEGKTVVTAFFKNTYKKDIRIIKNSTYYQELKDRMCTIGGEQVIFLPNNRDIIQYTSPVILDKTSIIVKKKISNFFYL